MSEKIRKYTKPPLEEFEMAARRARDVYMSRGEPAMTREIEKRWKDHALTELVARVGG